MSNTGWYGVDLDGTLAHYDKWIGELHIGAPVPLMVDRVKAWLAAGIEVRVFTARVHPSAGRNVQAIHEAIEEWCVQHVGRPLRATCQKDFAMIRLYDDRATQVEMNTGRLIGAEEE